MRARADLEATAKELFDVIAKGVVSVRVAQTFPLRDAESAPDPALRIH